MTDLIVETRPAFSVATRLISHAADHFGIEPLDVLRTRGQRRKFRARFAIIWALRQLGQPGNQNPYSYPRLAKLLGFDDHTSAWHGYKEAVKLRETDPDFRQLSNELLALAVSTHPQVRRAA